MGLWFRVSIRALFNQGFNRAKAFFGRGTKTRSRSQCLLSRQTRRDGRRIQTLHRRESSMAQRSHPAKRHSGNYLKHWKGEDYLSGKADLPVVNVR